MLKGPRKKTLPSCSLGFQEYEMDNASNFTRGFIVQQPEGVTLQKYPQTRLLMISVEEVV